MPAQKSKSEVVSLAKMGSRLVKAHKTHKGDERVIGNARLPAGIENGVAQLEDVKVGIYKTGKNEGKPYFLASGVVFKPESHEGVRIVGLHTQIGPEPLCDTPSATGKRKAFEDHYAWVLNQLRILGVNTEDIDGDTPEEVDTAFMAALEGLRQAKPFFRFRTWKGRKQEAKFAGGKYWVGAKSYKTKEDAVKANPYLGREPLINEEWNGVCEFEPDGDGASGTDDYLPDEPDEVSEDNGDQERDVPTAVKRKPAEMSAKPGRPKKAVPQEKEEPNEEFDEFSDLESLVAKAEARDTDAQDKLREMALNAGATDEDVDAADSWRDVLAMAEGTKRDGEEEEATEGEVAEENSVPKVGSTFGYKPLDSKTGKRAKKATEVEVMEVNDKKEICTARSLINPKIIYKGVAWDKLEPL